MYSFRLIRSFLFASAQRDLAYRANFAISLLNSLLSLGTSVIGLWVLFDQIENLQGWDFPQTLALLGVFFIVSALNGLFIGPGMERLAGLGQEIMTGNFDFTLLRPVNPQFLVTFREWRLFSFIDLALGIGVVVAAAVKMNQPLPWLQLLGFLAALLAAVVVIYSLLLAFTTLVFWSPGLMVTWVFDALFQMARYPVGIYPRELRFLLTWIVPVGIITTIPAQALTGQTAPLTILTSLGVSLVLLVGASLFFQWGLRRYASASS